MTDTPTPDETQLHYYYYSPASAIVIYRESDLCAHLIGAVLTFAIVVDVFFC
jgi:hypothetical protein